MKLPLDGNLTAPERQILERADKQNAKSGRKAYFEAVYVKNADGSDREIQQADHVANATVGSAAEINAIRDALVSVGLMKSS